MDSGVDQLLYSGLRGPITDQLNFTGRVGLLRNYRGGEDVLWRAELDHVAGAYTTESLAYSRELTEFHDDIIQGLDYSLQQILGPDLKAIYFANLGKVEFQTGDLSSRKEFRTGLLFVYTLSPKTEMHLGGTYADLSGPSHLNDSKTWTLRYEINYSATDTLTARLLYQYQKRSAAGPNSSYYENLVFLMLTKSFQ